jgi:hypothetical protein
MAIDDPPRLRPVPGWASATGTLSLGGGAPMSAATAHDRLALAERMARYCWAFDEQRRDLLAQCFSPDAVWQGDVMGEVQIGPFTGDEIVDWLGEFWNHQRFQRRHLILNFVVDELADMTATASCYLVLAGSKNASTRFEATGFYRISCVRSEGEWLIAHLVAGFDAPFWRGEASGLTPDVRKILGISS